MTGGSGFVGRKLCAELVGRGDHVTVLTRNVEQAKKHLPLAVRVAAWTPEKLGAWAEEIDVVDAVIHLAGESIVGTWTENKKRDIEESRVQATATLVEAIAETKHKPEVLVSASAIGFYGPQAPEVELDESAAPGVGFLADVVKEWEGEAKKAEELGVRTVQMRIGVVLGEGGGALEQMIKPFKFFMGGPLGDGNQVISWVHRDDVVGLFLLALDDKALRGPINVVSPNAVDSRELATAIGTVLNRPSWFRTPTSALKLALGEAAEIVTTGQRVFPRRAVDAGYEFHHARLLPALESILSPG
jgi:uncharacterized protein (TIGR01777 family)